MGGIKSDQANSIAIDAAGNVYSTGSFSGTADFDPGGGTFNLTSQGLEDVFISKLDAAGNFVWAKSIGSAFLDRAQSITFDAIGNIYIAGNYRGTADFDPGPGVYTLTPVGLFDIFVIKLNASGNLIWVSSIGGPDDDFVSALVVDGVGNIYATGSFMNTLDFDPGPAVFNLTPFGVNWDIYVCKLDASGAFVWAKQLGGTSSDLGYDIALDGADNVYTTGWFSSIADFDPGVGVYTLTPAGGANVFISKLDAGGNFVWAKSMGGTGASSANSIAIDALGNIFTTGRFFYILDCDPGPATYTLSSIVGTGFYDAFVSKLDASGNFVWAKKIGGPADDQGTSITFDTSGNAYIVGTFKDTIDVDPGPGIYNLIPTIGFNNTYACKLDISGNFVWAKILTGPGNVLTAQIEVDVSNNVYLGGYYNTTADFNPGPGSYTMNTLGDYDIFIEKLCQMATPTISAGGALTFCPGDSVALTSSAANSYSWCTGGATQSISVTTPGNYSLTVFNTNGCYATSQAITVTLFPLPSIMVTANDYLMCIGETVTLSATGANTYTWSTGPNTPTIAVSPSVTTSYTVSGSGLNGCAASFLFIEYVDPCAGIVEHYNQDSKIIVYPNPTNEILNIDTPEEMESIIQITNSLGELLLKEKINTRHSSFNIQNFPSSIYFIMIKEKNFAKTFKIIKE